MRQAIAIALVATPALACITTRVHEQGITKDDGLERCTSTIVDGIAGVGAAADHATA